MHTTFVVLVVFPRHKPALFPADTKATAVVFFLNIISYRSNNEQGSPVSKQPLLTCLPVFHFHGISEIAFMCVNCVGDKAAAH